MGVGPDMNASLERVNLRRTPSTTKISNIIHQAVSAGTPLFEEPTIHGDRETIQRKHNKSAKLCSHKLGYIMQSIERKK